MAKDTPYGLTVTSLRKIYDNSGERNSGVHHATFDLLSGSFFTLLGPSGCGKTTTLRCIAGLEAPDAGTLAASGLVFFDSDNSIEIPINRRQIGMVFQSYAIWPHMTVHQNVSFPLKVAKDRSFSRSEIDTLTQNALASVNLNGFGNQSATKLSGGQQQRVALARAIVRTPRLLLLDEPLSNLDAALRKNMRKELKRLQENLGITTVYVTHDQSEALEMSDQIAVLNEGVISQIGTPDDIYFNPKNRFVAEFVGQSNILSGTVIEYVTTAQEVSVRLLNGATIYGRCNNELQVGEKVSIAVRPESIHLESSESNAIGTNNRLHAEIEHSGFLGDRTEYVIRFSDSVLTALAEPKTRLETGASVIASFAPQDAVVMDETPC